MHDPLEDWAEKDKLLAEIGVEPPPPDAPAPPAPEPPSPALGPVRVVARPAEEAAPPPNPLPPSPSHVRGPASVVLLAVGVAWLAAGAGAGSAPACLAGLGFLAAGALGLLPVLRA